jgi:hypothetical protein
MILGSIAQAQPDPLYLIILMGQSNGAGRQDGRLANTLYNYVGIADGYPAQRTTQAQYSATPSDVIIYYKPTARTGDHSIDDGAWQAYEAGVNAGYPTLTSAKIWGSELSCATRIQQQTGKTVAIIKPAWQSTGLSRGTTSDLPGTWNYTSREVAAEFYIRRGIEDLKAAYPTRRIKLLAINWWQGETDGTGNIPSADYQRQFAEFKVYIDRLVGGLVVQDVPHIWNITRLDFNRTASEGVINDAIDAIEAAYLDVYKVNAAGYPQSDEMTSAEASPVAVGNPNANGWPDDDHSSYIAQLAIGEQQFDNILAAGLI